MRQTLYSRAPGLRRLRRSLAVTLALFSAAGSAFAETGYDAWLRYRPIADDAARHAYRTHATTIAIDGQPAPILRAAAEELRAGLAGLTGQDVAIADAAEAGSIVLRVDANAGLGADGFALRSEPVDGRPRTLILGANERGVLYGAFALLRRVQTGQPIESLDVRETPAFALRMVNTWDNPNGTIERGYGGRSVFKWDTLPTPDPRHRDYARLLASVGIQAIAINNVNADARYLTTPHLEKVAAVAEAFRPYGVQLFISISFDSPRRLGNLKTADPLDAAVQKWWADAATEAYRVIPDLGGFLIKADSEGQPGPYAYGRDHAEGANMLAAALKPHGGTLIWRAFVYQNDGTDRLKMAYDTFKPLDGKFADNVIVQVKNGPLDFQVREPVNPLFGAMPKTNLLLEIQSSQEYTGHDLHLCYLAPMWREVFQFDTHANGPGSTVAKVLSTGPLQGVANVVNLGDDANWAGHDLAMANVYAAGRLSWDPSLDTTKLAEEWTRQTFGNDGDVVSTITSMLAESHEVYESYTSPLGLGVMHESAVHLDPAPQIRYGFHQADKNGMGYDRTRATGSGYVDQYFAPAAAMYEKIETTPENLLLFFHHLPYGHRMKDGRTLIQTLYDGYFDGVRRAETFGERWQSLAGKIDAERHAAVATKFALQAVHAGKWRDAMTLFWHQVSGEADAKRRVRSQYRLTR